MTDDDYRVPRGYPSPADPYLTAAPYRLDDRDRTAELLRADDIYRPVDGHRADPYSPDPYGHAPYGGYRGVPDRQPYPPYPYPAPEHPQGATVLILGVLSVIFAPLGFAAWYLGSRAQREIAETGAVYSNTGNITAGKIIGMITSIATIVSAAFVVLYVAFMIIMVIGATGIG
ncbi:DUF4190 domain-containing protein [Microlunatus soli]|uniref:DUF4190 domain-containing protein n=1 Tax=Microlunatus soli TaxID=630515 RepID=A0A1H1X119_9ACTN|nr:DUF4190 domain-containing protein [Microlunatus soli]SDT02872.1 hypothetical protein SAMN04489812_3887 [Microlunatus soli]